MPGSSRLRVECTGPSWWISVNETAGSGWKKYVRRSGPKLSKTGWNWWVVLPLYGKARDEARGQFAQEVIRFELELLRENKIDARLATATLILSNKMSDRKRLEAMWEEIKMLDIIEIAREKGIDEGKILGIKEGKTQGIEEGSLGAAREMIPDLLFDRFGIVAMYIQEEIGKIKSLRVLKALQLQAYRCADLESFKAMLGQAGEASKSEKTQAPRVN